MTGCVVYIFWHINCYYAFMLLIDAQRNGIAYGRCFQRLYVKISLFCLFYSRVQCKIVEVRVPAFKNILSCTCGICNITHNLFNNKIKMHMGWSYRTGRVMARGWRRTTYKTRTNAGFYLRFRYGHGLVWVLRVRKEFYW